MKRNDTNTPKTLNVFIFFIKLFLFVGIWALGIYITFNKELKDKAVKFYKDIQQDVLKTEEQLKRLEDLDKSRSGPFSDALQNENNARLYKENYASLN